MAEFKKIIPHLLKWECKGLTQADLALPVDQLFAKARQGGYANLKNDKGGHTMCGVTLDTYKAYCAKKGLKNTTWAHFRAMPFTHWYAIAKEMFWDRWRADEIRSQSVAEMLVDWTWHSGSHGIVRPQRLLGVLCDGVVGKVTISAVNAREPQALWAALFDEREKFYRSIGVGSQAGFLKGWLNRLNDLKFKE